MGDETKTMTTAELAERAAEARADGQGAMLPRSAQIHAMGAFDAYRRCLPIAEERDKLKVEVERLRADIVEIASIVAAVPESPPPDVGERALFDISRHLHPSAPPEPEPEPEQTPAAVEWGPPTSWSSGRRPVPASEVVRVRFDGRPEWVTGRAGYWQWYSGGIANITQYQRQAQNMPQTPAARVAAMSDDEVERLMSEAGVGPWVRLPREDGASVRRYQSGMEDDDAIDWNGRCYRRYGHSTGGLYNYGTGPGDTTTEAGRMACTRRLAVHILTERDDG